jgi:hypothetical protein
MAQLGKYDSDRDNILHFMCTSDWANESFGDVEAPTGYVWRISNTRNDVFGCFDQGNSEFDSLIEDQLAAYGIEDSPEFRSSLVGNFLVYEDSSGFVSVLKVPSESALIVQFNATQEVYEAWLGDEDE